MPLMNPDRPCDRPQQEAAMLPHLPSTIDSNTNGALRPYNKRQRSVIVLYHDLPIPIIVLSNYNMTCD